MEVPQTIVLDRERTVGEILRDALSMYARYPLLFATLAVGVIAPYELARFGVTGRGPYGSGGRGGVEATVLFQLLYYAMVGPLISALHVHAVIEIGEGRKPRLGSVALRGLRVLPVVAAAAIVAGILIFLGFLALIVPGVILALRWSVVAQTAAVDHEGWLPALKRSSQLASGNYWHIFGLLFTLVLLLDAIALGADAAGAGNGTSMGSVLIGIAIWTIVASFQALTEAILYFDLRAREGRSRSSPRPEYEHLRDLD